MFPLLSWSLWLHFRLVDYQWCQWQVLHWFHSVWNRQNLMQMLQLMSLKKPKMIITGLVFLIDLIVLLLSPDPLLLLKYDAKKRYCVVIFAPINVQTPPTIHESGTLPTRQYIIALNKSQIFRQKSHYWRFEIGVFLKDTSCTQSTHCSFFLNFYPSYTCLHIYWG